MFPDLTQTLTLAFPRTLSFRLCMIITLFGIYRFIPCLMTLTLFQSQMCQETNCNFCIPHSLPLCRFKGMVYVPKADPVQYTLCHYGKESNTTLLVLYLNMSRLSRWMCLTSTSAAVLSVFAQGSVMTWMWKEMEGFRQTWSLQRVMIAHFEKNIM